MFSSPHAIKIYNSGFLFDCMGMVARAALISIIGDAEAGRSLIYIVSSKSARAM